MSITNCPCEHMSKKWQVIVSVKREKNVWKNPSAWLLAALLASSVFRFHFGFCFEAFIAACFGFGLKFALFSTTDLALAFCHRNGFGFSIKAISLRPVRLPAEYSMLHYVTHGWVTSHSCSTERTACELRHVRLLQHVNICCSKTIYAAGGDVTQR